MSRVIWFVLLLVGGCSPSCISVKQEFVNRDTLASTFVKSPDPMQCHAPMGQRLYVQWNLSKPYQDAELKLSLILKDLTERVVRYPVTTKRGTVTYELLCEEYIESEGLLAYKAEIFCGDEIIAKWKHQMWVELIHMDESDEFTQ